ncbi:MAG: hypothetical protein HW407_1230 [Bacteroidetes bacterium]|nr:hypothetical protein [Bacteroidota bacterium]
MSSTDEFKTLQNQVRQEIRVQGSRFICTLHPVRTKEEAEEFVGRIRKEFFNATHHCYAYRLGTAGDRFRYNDDGEPGGTGGKPILTAIDRIGLTDVVAVVTRYFGGTKLGVGGLARAYGEAAEKAMSSAEPVTRYVLLALRVSFPHTHISNVMHVVSKLGARIVDTVYDEEVHLQLEIRVSRREELQSSLVNHTSGNIRFT